MPDTNVDATEVQNKRIDAVRELLLNPRWGLSTISEERHEYVVFQRNTVEDIRSVSPTDVMGTVTHHRFGDKDTAKFACADLNAIAILDAIEKAPRS